MKLAEKIEHLEHSWGKPWQNCSYSRKSLKRLQHRIWRRWSKKNLEENSNNPLYNRYSGWEY